MHRRATAGADVDAAAPDIHCWCEYSRSRHGSAARIARRVGGTQARAPRPVGTLSAQLKEEVRRTLAQHTGCQFCASLGQPAETHASRQESLAVAFADAVALDHTAISDAQVQLLSEEFTVPQIVELLMWISFEYAGQMFGCLIGDEPATAVEKQAFADSIGNA